MLRGVARGFGGRDPDLGVLCSHYLAATVDSILPVQHAAFQSTAMGLRLSPVR